MSNHLSSCRCKDCENARRALGRIYVKEARSVPRHILEEYKERKAKQEELELWKGIMVVQCTKCRHQVKVKVSPTIRCPQCGKDM